jgi:hypothetical protein
MAKRPPKPNPARVTKPIEPRPGERVVVGVISGGSPALAFHESIKRTLESYLRSPLAYRFDEQGWHIMCRSSANVSRGRNKVVLEFLRMEHQPEWLLLIDDDMAWEPQAIERLLDQADPTKIVGGLCFAYGPDTRIIPTIFQEGDTRPYETPDEDYKLPAVPTMVQVAGTGAAFLLMHREALLKIAELTPGTPNAWFREVEVMIPNPKHDPDNPDPKHPEQVPHWISEDLWFCNLAYQAGFTVWVHTGVEVEHIKQHRLTRDLFETAPTLVVHS